MCSQDNDNINTTKPKSKGKIFLLVLAIVFLDLIFAAVLTYGVTGIKNLLYKKYQKHTTTMPNIQKEIKKNWNPVKLEKSKKVVLLFKVYKDGSISDIKIYTSSGNEEMDNSAILAVEKSNPLPPLPKECKHESVDILFNFDYNVFGTEFVKDERK